ncbi:MAG: hypothetical protein ACFB8W_17060 [Elainellaceae cyanobacterium]
MALSKTRKLTTILVGTGTLLSLLGVGAATASLLPGGIGSDWQDWVLSRANPLEDILSEIRSSDSVLQRVMDAALGDFWEELQSSTDSELPDPYEVRVAAEEPAGTGVLSSSPTVRQRDLANLYDQEVARATAALLLGETGEERLTQQAEQTAELIESSQQGAADVLQMAEEAQGLSVTQDVMKAQAEMNGAIASLMAQQTQLAADNHTSLMQTQRLQSILAQLAANTSEGIDESNRRERVERQVEITGSAQAPIYIPGLLGTGDAETP